MDTKSLLAPGIAISLSLYGLLSLSMPSIYSHSGICLGFSGHLFYLITGLGFLLAGLVSKNWTRSSSLLAALLFAPQVLAFDTTDFSYNFIGPVHLVYRHQIGDALILHINFFALTSCTLLLLNIALAGRNPRMLNAPAPGLD